MEQSNNHLNGLLPKNQYRFRCRSSNDRSKPKSYNYHHDDPPWSLNEECSFENVDSPNMISTMELRPPKTTTTIDVDCWCCFNCDNSEHYSPINFDDDSKSKSTNMEVNIQAFEGQEKSKSIVLSNKCTYSSRFVQYNLISVMIIICLIINILMPFQMLQDGMFVHGKKASNAQNHHYNSLIHQDSFNNDDGHLSNSKSLFMDDQPNSLLPSPSSSLLSSSLSVLSNSQDDLSLDSTFANENDALATVDDTDAAAVDDDDDDNDDLIESNIKNIHIHTSKETFKDDEGGDDHLQQQDHSSPTSISTNLPWTSTLIVTSSPSPSLSSEDETSTVKKLHPLHKHQSHQNDHLFLDLIYSPSDMVNELNVDHQKSKMINSSNSGDNSLKIPSLIDNDEDNLDHSDSGHSSVPQQQEQSMMKTSTTTTSTAASWPMSSNVIDFPSSSYLEDKSKLTLISSEDFNVNDNSIHGGDGGADETFMTIATTTTTFKTIDMNTKSTLSNSILDDDDTAAQISFEFTKPVYNVNIPENSLSKIYATSTEKMGIYISDPALTVRYKIVAGDPEKIFRADHRHVGNFYFLLIRVRHDKNAILNRENRSKYELRIRATITSEHNKQIRFKSKCNVTVTVLDCNDISPIFFEKSYDVDVLEDVPLETRLIQVTAIDPDMGLNGEIYYSLADQTKYFAIHPTLGIVYNTRPLYLHKLLSTNENHLDSSREFTVNLTIQARDRGHHLSSQTIESSKTKVNIRILPVNRHSPQISIKQHSTLPMVADLASSIYAVIHVSDDDLGIYGQICSLDIIEGNDQSIFRLTNQTANDYNLQMSKSLTDLLRLSTRSLPFELVLQSRDCGGRLTNKTIHISMDDHFILNLHFSTDKYYRELHESSLIGTQVLQVDLKLSYNNNLDRISTSSLNNGNKLLDSSTTMNNNIIHSDLLHFSIINGNENNTFGITNNGIIYTRSRLDRESVSNYLLVVRAQHQLNQIATTMVYIDIIDDNDNYPTFKNVPPNGIVQLTINENKPNGSVIYRVEADDLDTDANNRYVTFEMVYYGQDQDDLPFQIDAYSGNVSIIQTLDYESMAHNYLLFIRASDWGEPFRRQSQIVLNITIVDVNDHRPQFEKINCTVYIALDTKPFTEIMKLFAIDLDRHSNIIYKMFSSTDAERCFRLDEKSGQLELICNLKKEIKSPKLHKVLWTLSTSATDGLYFSDANYINVILVEETKIKDQNQRPKRLSSNNNNNTNDKQINVQCIDSGIRHRSKHQNRISSSKQHHHQHEHYHFGSSLSLQPEEKQALEQLFHSKHEHENHAPFFDETFMEMSLAENTKVGTKIATIFANDTDTGFESALIWSLNLQETEIHDGFYNNNQVYFEIGQFDGHLYLISPLDYETIKQIKLLITVCDQCIYNQKCANKTVQITIEDVNDNQPILDNYVMEVSEASQPGSIIGTVHGEDHDSGDNALLEYYLDGHIDLFSIDLLNGTIRLEEKLDREIVDKYILYVTASDCGLPSLSTTAVITIHVTDINDNAPLFFQSHYFMKVREDIPIGTRLMRISAFDQDEGDSAEIRYTIANTEDDTFAIDDLTGNIRLKKSLDYEKIQLYNLTIVANDEGTPMLSSNTYLLLEVQDVNENYYAPKFPNYYDNATVKENLPIGTFVTQVSAIDPDNPDIPVIYQIIGGDGLGRFTIDSTGNIYTAAILDCEINSHFWLTIVAKDRAAVPLSSYLELYIEVEDVNDMPPITKQSFYTANVLENVTIGTVILQIEAYDQDVRLSKNKPEIVFKIVNKNIPFEIDSKGLLKTNGQLDRESVSRYVIDLDIIEPTIGLIDNVTEHEKMATYLKSRTPIIINVLDVNEYAPKSIMNTYRCYTYSEVLRNQSVCQIIAYDQDDDDHCPINYQIIEGNEKNYFHLDSNSGLIYPTVDQLPTIYSYDFVVKITDCHSKQHTTNNQNDDVAVDDDDDDDDEHYYDDFSSIVHVIIRVLPMNLHEQNHKPLIEPFDSIIMINRNENVGHTAAWIKTSDDDNDRLCFYIINGNLDNSFAFLDNEELVLAKSLKNQQFINQFNLTLLATDGQDNSSINLLVNIVNDYDEVMALEQPQTEYVVNVFENITIGSDVFQLNVADNDQTIFFAIYSTQSPETLTKFEVESWSGKIIIKSALDYEQGKQHVLLIEARSGRKYSKSINQRAFSKVIINVIDVNDQAPQFITAYFETNVVESSAIGTSILQVQAFDGDFGQNAKINYSIASGNIDNTFDIEPNLGYLFVSKTLNSLQLPEYYLLVKATDQGMPPLSNTANVRILITLPDQSPPKFEQSNYMVDVREDEKIGTVILSLKMVNKQTSFFTIINGNDDNTFAINVNNGELYLRKTLDFEHRCEYQLTVEASNLLAMNVSTKVFITVVDINDNAPFWNQTLFEGQVFETTPINTFVQTEQGTPLVVKAYDKDSFNNLVYSINEDLAKQYFSIEPRTGAISLIKMMDCEKDPNIMFTISVNDNGTPKLRASNNAMVRIKCLPVNDCPPVFIVDKFYGTLLLPTYPNVIITKITATDCDYKPDKNNMNNRQQLQYSLKPLNDIDEMINFKINSTTGEIMTVNDSIKPATYEMLAIATDGKFNGEARVIINAKPMPISSLRFRQKTYHASIRENSTHLRNIIMPAIEGNQLHEHLIFRIITPTNLFKIARTSGAILYRGIPVDRETLPKIVLVIEVQSISFKNRISQALVEITVEDINDNGPIFVGLPYNFVYHTDTNVGDLIGKIQAVDMDIGLNGKVHYSIVSGDNANLFTLNYISGQLTLSRAISNADSNNYTLLVMAKDLGKPSMESLINVTLRMVTGGIPLFTEPFYNITINENHPPMLPFITVKAESSHGRQIFYQIQAGNDNDEFLLDFNTGTVSIVEKLDRETTSQYNLLISAIDAISDASSTVNLYIKVDDVNDNQPMFTRFYYNVSIPENLMVGSSVLKVEAYDADSGQNSRLQYHILGKNKSRFFISPDEGVIYLKNSLDYESEPYYHFNIMVTDYGTPQLTSTAQVFIEILDVNDNAPVLPPSFTTSIDEDIEKGEFVTKITAFDADSSDHSTLRYKILSGSNMAFSINETTGSIYVRNLKNFPYYYHHRFDHRIIKRHYTLNISVTDGIHSTTETYSIVIKPSNHHSPRFSRLLNNVAIDENQPIGTNVLMVNATDPDYNPYGQIEYHILNDYAKKFFSIDQNSGQIKLKTELDYEQGEKFYWLILAAQDKGRRVGVSAARIAIIDQNDNIPRFIVNEYKCSICSNVEIGSTILSVLALDDDEDAENTIIQYSIYDDQENQAIENNMTMTMKSINDYFEISSDTGYIYIRKNLSSLIGKKIQFFVKASNVINDKNDNNSQRKLNFNVVPVTIEIVDSCPYYKREAFLYEVFVKENIERGSIVATLNLGHYKEAELNIVGLDNMMDMNKFRIDNYGKINVNEPLDREIKSKHVLALKVSDRYYLTTDYFYVIINIMDENDCTPYFDSTSYYLNVAENQEIGSTIFKMNALDNDIDLHNNALKYSIQDDYQDTFRIDENSGWIMLSGPLDRETMEHYNLQIDITDGTHTNSTWLHIVVFDVNDNQPRIEQSRSIAAIYENSFLGTVILRVKVDDPDLNSELRYFISHGDPSNHFAISSSGDVYVNRTLDRETIDHYSLIILVSDGKYHSEAQVEIDVLDVNDNGPICVKSKYVEMVSEAVPVGTYILTVEATDQDDGDNAKLYFKLFDDNQGPFVVDANTGKLKTNAKLDRELQSHYLLKVVVYDFQNREWHCESIVEILLSDVNDEPPKFLMQLNSVQVPEDCPVGTILGKVSAIDLDIGPNRQITYEMLNSTKEFFIDETSGLIRLAKSLDRETEQFYNLTIIAYDQNLPYLNSTTTFSVNVTDINDNAPEFELQSYKASIDENVAIGTEVVKIFATSKDSGLNAEIQYKILNGNINDTFAIDNKNGIVSVANEIDYETTNEYFLTIEAQDRGVPPLCSEVNLLITINDINDMRPQFSQRSYDIVIREDAEIGDKIYQIVASDGDSPPNANLSYSFENGQLSYKEFNIEPNLGILTVGKQLDREMISSYILEVFCTDNGHPLPLTASVLINIEISDYNDNVPLFDKINQTIYLKENRPIGYKFMEFNIYDADSSLNSGPFKFEFVEGNEQHEFIIYDSDGSLRTNASFNHTKRSEYNLKIKVTDSGSPPLHSFTWLTVIVVQESKTPPKVYPLSIAINSLDHFPGGMIGQINATDDDQFDRLTYSLTNIDDQNIFQVDQNEGFIRALPGLDVGKYKINVSVSDGKFVSYGLVQIDVFIITEPMVENSIVIKIFSIEAKEFITNYFKNFIRSLKSLFKVRMKDVIVISLQQLNGQTTMERRKRDDGRPLDISVMFTIANHDDGFVSRPVTRAKLLENKYLIENQIGLSFDELSHQSQCKDMQCHNGECREELLLNEDQITYITTSTVTFVSPHHQLKFGCACRPGFGGKLCNVTVNECYRNPCPTNKECLPVSSSLGYVCQCPFGKSGPNCNQIAQTCQANERDVLVCYQEFNPISFNGNSYVRYSPTKKIDKLSFRFRTQQLRARILTQENHPLFIILEIIGGYIQYRFDCGEGEGLIRLHNLFVSDGKWHEIIVERKANTASLLLDRKYRSGGFAPGATHSCNRLKADIYFGGQVKSNSDNVGDENIFYGFNGCLDHILFNGQQIPFHKTSKSAIVVLKTLANVEFSCSFKPEIGVCKSQPCLNGGICKNVSNDSFECSCQGQRFKGKHCEIDTMPCSSAPCMNEGVCIPDVDACEKGMPNCYKCQCRSGFNGTNCQIAHHCTSKFCQNGGVCEETAIGPKCHCHSGWHGLYCEQDIDECQLNTPACHSSASCVNLPGTFRCVCPLNSTLKCKSHSLLTSNILGSYFHVSYEELAILFIVLVCLILIILLMIICCTCCHRQSKKKKKHTERDDRSEAGESLLKKNNSRSGTTFDNCDPNNDKGNNFEMINMVNNVSHINNNNNNGHGNHHSGTEHSADNHQRPSPFQHQDMNINNNNNKIPTMVESNINLMDDFETPTPNSIVDYGQQFPKKNAPIASVSPQMIEIKQSKSNHSKKNKKKFVRAIINNTGHTHVKRASLNDSSDSNVFENGQTSPACSSSNQTEGYHWDTSDLCLDENSDSTQPTKHAFTMVQYEFSRKMVNDDIDIVATSSHHSQKPECNINNYHNDHRHQNTSTFVKSVNRKPKEMNNCEPIHDSDEISPLLSKNVEDSKQNKSDSENQLPSPPLEVKLGPKLEFSKNYFERYLPKHEEDGLTFGQRCNGKNSVDNGNKQSISMNKNDPSTSVQNAKSATFLTFNRCSLNESADNFSLLTPSSSCSTTPIAALVASGSSTTSDIIDQCSSSMSSSSNTDLKISPMSSFMMSNANANNEIDKSTNNQTVNGNNHQTNNNNNKIMSSFSVYSNMKRSLLSNNTNGMINHMETNGNHIHKFQNNNHPVMSSFTKPTQTLNDNINNNNNSNHHQTNSTVLKTSTNNNTIVSTTIDNNNHEHKNQTTTNFSTSSNATSATTTPSTAQYTFV